MNNGHLFLREDCIDWLLSYAADELSFQGVPCVTPGPETTAKANCSAVADLRIQWNFTEKVWDAEFVAGGLAGMSRRFGFEKPFAQMHYDIWKGLKEQSLIDCDLSHAPRIERKKAAKEFITLWCQAIDNKEGGAFEQEWGLLQETKFETPMKKRRGSDEEHTAVAEANVENDDQ